MNNVTQIRAHNNLISDLSFAPTDKKFVTASDDGTCGLFDFETQEKERYECAVLFPFFLSFFPFLSFWNEPQLKNTVMYCTISALLRSATFSFFFFFFDYPCLSLTGNTAQFLQRRRNANRRSCEGHGSKVHTVDWHPSKGLIASGSQDATNPVKLWDPRTANCLSTLHMHKNSVQKLQWNMNGNWLLTASRDKKIKLFDVRTMKEFQTFDGHPNEVVSLAWHPIHEQLFCSGDYKGNRPSQCLSL